MAIITLYWLKAPTFKRIVYLAQAALEFTKLSSSVYSLSCPTLKNHDLEIL